MGGKPLLQSPRDALKRVQTSLLDKCGLSIKVLQKTMHLPASPTMFGEQTRPNNKVDVKCNHLKTIRYFI